MTKRIQAKHKVDRRLGVNLWGRPKSPFNTRAFGPGQHGQTRARGKPSDYKIQLQAKQKLKGYYGNLNERQFRNVFQEAERVRGNTGENLVGILESRLDAVVYRAKFALTVFQARQIINHGHIKVNGGDGPGQHGQTRARGKPSDYKIQLQAKQKLKGYYGNLNERQFRNVFQEAERVRGNTGENLVGILESRLDAVVYRAKFALTVFQARQIINHGHIKVNGKKVNVGSYSLKENDEIEVRDSSKQLTTILSSVASKEREVPEYVVVDHKQLTAKYTRVPKMEEIPYPAIMEPNLVVEYYSR